MKLNLYLFNLSFDAMQINSVISGSTTIKIEDMKFVYFMSE